MSVWSSKVAHQLDWAVAHRTGKRGIQARLCWRRKRSLQVRHGLTPLAIGVDDGLDSRQLLSAALLSTAASCSNALPWTYTARNDRRSTHRGSPALTCWPSVDLEFLDLKHTRHI